jgi:hypothetical protein
LTGHGIGKIACFLAAEAWTAVKCHSPPLNTAAWLNLEIPLVRFYNSHGLDEAHKITGASPDRAIRLKALIVNDTQPAFVAEFRIVGFVEINETGFTFANCRAVVDL